MRKRYFIYFTILILFPFSIYANSCDSTLFPAVFTLDSLDGTNGFILDGINADDFSGKSVSQLGDINDDGIDDFIISAWFANGNGTESGESYVVFGNNFGFPSPFDLASLNGTNGFIIHGVNAGDRSGHSVSGLGDVNNDGIDDFIIGAIYADPNGSASGESYVVFGNASFSSPFDLNTLNGSNGFVLNGINADDFSGISVSDAGDINDDGMDDLLIGAYFADPNGKSGAGQSYVVYGSNNPFSSPFELNSLNGSNGFIMNGIDASDNSGVSVSKLGDVNGDGINDLIIGAYRAEIPGINTDRGQSYVVYGSNNPFSSPFELDSLNGSNGFTINGIDVGDISGYAVSGLGDVNADGMDDILIGAPFGRVNGTWRTGESYVVFGSTSFSSSFEVSSLNGSNGFILNGIDASDESGFSVSGLGDVNHDGIDDLIIGAPFADPNGSKSGEAYIVFGCDDPFATFLELDSLDGSDGFIVEGMNGNDQCGYTVSELGDVNADGIDDIIIGANEANNGAGQSYVIFGRDGSATSSITNDTSYICSGDSVFLQNEYQTAGGTYFDTLQTFTGCDSVVQTELIIHALPTADAGNDTTIHLGSSVNLVASGGASYLWSTGETTDTITVSPASDSTYIVTVMNVNGCSSTDSVKVFVQANPSNPCAGLFPAEFNLSDIDGNNGFAIIGIDMADYSGISVSDIGDINNDGFDDVMIGAWEGDPNGNNNAGESYVVFGKSSFSTPLELSTLNGINGFTINGISSNDKSGYNVSSAGDVNNDGFDDAIISTVLANNGKGQTYVVFGNSSFPSSLNLSSLNGSNGFTINGIDVGDASGRSISSAGDINNDGFDDIIIGAVLADPNGNSESGESYIIFGNSSFPSSINLSSLNGTNGFTINGIDLGDRTGSSVSSAGDINKDGFDDVIIGAFYADPNGNNKAGESYIIYGNTSFPSVINLSTLNGNNGFTINGIDPNDESGHSVSGVGDINNDGYDDVIIGAPFASPNGNNDAGESYIVFGNSSFPASLDLYTLNGSNGFIVNGISPNDRFGWSVNNAGDMNNDGFNDIIIGAPFTYSEGESYVIYGKSSFSSSLNLSTLNGSNGFTINGIDLDDRLGLSVSSAGDINNDGFDDVIVSAPFAGSNGLLANGESYIIFGGPNINITHDTSYICQGDSAFLEGDFQTTAGTYFDTLQTSIGCDSIVQTELIIHALPTADAGNDVTINLGSSVNLVASGGASYLWSTGETTDTITVSPTSDSTFIVTATDTNGCSNTDDVTVFVIIDPCIPSIPTTFDTSYICQGDSIFLQNDFQTLAGTYFDTLQTSTGCDSVIQTELFIYPITPLTEIDEEICAGDSVLTPGGYVFTDGVYTDTLINQLGCDSIIETTVTVHPLPVADAGDDVSFCEGQNPVQLQATGGTQYSWSPVIGLNNPNISDPIASPTHSIIYTVTVIDANGCSGSDDVQINVYPAAIAEAGSDQTICIGQEVELQGSGGVAYNWTPAIGLNNGMLSNPMASPDNTTTYTLTVTDVNGCTNSDDVVITVDPAPFVAHAGDDQDICSGEQVQLQATGEDGASFAWTPSDGLSDPFISNPLASPASTTTYLVTVTNSDGCVDYDEMTITVTICTSIKDAGPLSNATLSPNPAFDYIQIASLPGGKTSVEIYSLEGKLITEKTEYISPGNEMYIDLHELSGGMYYVHATSSTGNFIIWKIMVIK